LEKKESNFRKKKDLKKRGKVGKKIKKYKKKTILITIVIHSDLGGVTVIPCTF
jgi:hypothetical protein